MVLVIRDVSEQSRIRREREMSLSLFANMLNGFAYCQMLFEEGRPQDFIYLAANDAFETLTGLKNVVGKKVSEVIPGIRDSDPEMFNMYGRVAATGVPERTEIFVNALDMWFSLSVYCPHQGHFVAVFDVITDRKRVEDRVRKLSLAVQQSPASVVITDTSGQIEYVNAKFTEVTGYTFDEVCGKNPSILKSGELPAEGYRQLWQTISSGGQWRGEFHNKKKNGELYWESASISPVFDESGKITHFVAVKEDITQRKELEKTLAVRERQLNSFFLGATAGLALFDRDLRYVQVNQTLADINGITAEEHIGKRVRDVVPQIAVTAEPLLRKVLATGEPKLDFEAQR